jgi:hypothetical protein
MKLVQLLVWIAAISLSGCGSLDKRPRIETTTIKLVEDNGVRSLVLEPPVLLFDAKAGLGDAIIVWRLDPESKLKFAPMTGIDINGEIKEVTGIEPLSRVAAGQQRSITERLQKLVPIEDEQIGRCKLGPDDQSYICLNKRTRKGQFKYTIRVNDGKEQFTLDPDVWNW